MISPDDLRDLARVIGGEATAYRPNKESHRTAAMIRARLVSEAARREAEAKELGRTQLADGVHHSAEAADCNPIVERKGPGSADARKCRSCGAGAGDMCGMFGQAPRPDDCLASYKPAPAADDLVVNLRAAHGGQYVDDANMCGKAADRIEALRPAWRG